MTFPVVVHPLHDQFEAALVGAPDVRATAATREEALSKLEAAIAQRLDQGELVMLEVRRRGLAGLFGKFRADPTLREICEHAYQERDADRQEGKPSTLTFLTEILVLIRYNLVVGCPDGRRLSLS
jgi:hypothetical protein